MLYEQNKDAIDEGADLLVTAIRDEIPDADIWVEGFRKYHSPMAMAFGDGDGSLLVKPVFIDLVTREMLLVVREDVCRRNQKQKVMTNYDDVRYITADLIKYVGPDLPGQEGIMGHMMDQLSPSFLLGAYYPGVGIREMKSVEEGVRTLSEDLRPFMKAFAGEAAVMRPEGMYFAYPYARIKPLVA